MLKHFFFDLDETLTPSRSPMLSEHTDLFERLTKERDVIVVSGAQESQMKKQLPQKPLRYYLLTQNGNRAIDPEGNVLWSESFSEAQTEAIFSFIAKIKNDLNLKVKNEDDLVENRGSQISYSLIGHNEELKIKKAFDPDGSKRKNILASHTTDVQDLLENKVEVTVGGTTCFDFFLAGKNKGYNITRLIERLRWPKDECIYFGDALEPGRNDESVIGIIPTQAVKGPEETFRFIEEKLIS